MKAVNPKITSFFTSKGNLGVKRPCEDEDSDSENSKNNQPQVPICNDVISTDISLFVNRRLSDEEKLLVLKNVWKPQKNYDFPLLELNKGRSLKFQYAWLDKYSWLAYSKALNGAFCKYCVVFAGNTGGVGNQPLGNLVISPFQQYKNAHRTLGIHQAREYHIASVTDSEHFIRIKENNQPTIVEKIDSNRRAKIIENRKRLIPIIECVLLCGREEIPLRGHSDYGRIIVDDDHDGSREGNFRAILKYRAKGDQFLKNILEGPVNSAKCFSILADETTDISTKEQLSLTVRYIDDDAILHEDFLQFYVIESLTGSDLASSILNALSSCGIDCDFLYGQGYDGASNMSGKYNGVQTVIRQKYPKALYLHCAAHSLNLAVSTSCNIKSIRNCLGVVEKLYVFFNTPKRQNVLISEIEKSDTEFRVKTLKRLCVTRWVEKYDSLNDFYELFPVVVKALDTICSEWSDTTDASILKKCILDSEFLIALSVTKLLFSFGLPLCK
ncbi:unnamed protein product [Macrosiphum euphorbiae]|uniref:DUF4371 domain-containing protein n=1 Tax=Macrosiphum euphorbiae TaxID=13131 RepID=A0AAV0YAS0_9HEMI|nr:unnamed protein product [Macrosiphum euphorbiae]